MEDLAQALTNSLSRDGRGGMTGPLRMNGQRLVGLAPGTEPTDAATVAQIVDGPPGPPGTSDNTYTPANGGLAAFKASDIGRRTASLVGIPGVADGRFNWTLGNYVGQADDVNIIASNSTPQSTGAWVRQRAAGVSTLAPGTGATTRQAQDKLNERISSADYATPQAAADARTVTGGKLKIPPASVDPLTLGSRKVGLAGDGIRASFIPVPATGVAVRGVFTEPSWDSVPVSDLNLKGTGTLQGVGYSTGPDAYTPSAEYAGRTIVSRIRFENLDKAVSRPFGNIGWWGYDLQFEAANYHIWSRANTTGQGDIMHAGCVFLQNGHATGAQKASIYINSPTVGTGQAVFEGTIFENNPGWVLYVKTFPSIDGQPSVVMRSCWNELNYTAASVTVEGDTRAPGFAYLEDVASALFDDTPVGPLTLIRSNVTTTNSDLSKLTSVSMDTVSTLSHHMARRFSGTAPGLTHSIGAVANATALSSPFFRMPRPKGVIDYGLNSVVSWDAQTPQDFTGSVSRSSVVVNDDPVLPGRTRTQNLVINNGETLLPPFVTIPGNGTWLVLQILVRKVFGAGATARLNGSAGLGGPVVIDNDEWRMLTGIIQNTGPDVAGNSLYFTNNTGATSTLRFGGYCLSRFVNAQDALAYANSGLFMADQRPVYAPMGVTVKRSFDATTATLADIANVLGTLIGDIQTTRLPR